MNGISSQIHFARGRAERRVAWAAIGVTVALIAGCGPTTGTPVQGTIRLAGGEPLDRGMIFFVNQAITCRGVIGADGRYLITSGPNRSRVPAGRYKVFFTDTGIPQEGSMETLPQVAAHLEVIETTDLVADVPDRPTGVTLDFTVAKAKRKQ